MFTSNTPSIDLHGETRDSARVLVKEFLNDNIKLGNEYLTIIHGIGSGVLKNEVHKVLKNNRKVISYKLDNFNSGVTQVRVYIDKKGKMC